MEGMDDLAAALHQMPQALGLTVLEGHFAADRPQLLFGQLRQQPLGPELIVAGFLILTQRPVPVGLVALLDLVVKRLRVRLARQLRHAPLQKIRRAIPSRPRAP